MVANILLGCVAAGAIMAMIGIWFPDFFRGETGQKLMASSVAILVSAAIAGFVLWVSG